MRGVFDEVVQCRQQDWGRGNTGAEVVGSFGRWKLADAFGENGHVVAPIDMELCWSVNAFGGMSCIPQRNRCPLDDAKLPSISIYA